MDVVYLRMDSYRYYTEEAEWTRDSDFGESVEWDATTETGYRGSFY